MPIAICARSFSCRSGEANHYLLRGLTPIAIDEAQRLRDELGMTVLLVEQKLPFARAVADDFAIMERGSIVAGGPMASLGDDLVERYLAV